MPTTVLHHQAGETSAGARNLEQQDRVYIVGRGTGDRSRKSMAISLPVLQEWWRCFYGALLHRTRAGWYTHVSDGAVPRTDADDRWFRCL